MAVLDSVESTHVLEAFQLAWRDAIKRYGERRVNSERCLQAYLFLYLNKRLSRDFRVFVEATIRVPTGADDAKYTRIAIDTLICKNDSIYAAIELKFSPMGQPRPAGVRKDVQSLSAIKNRLKVEMPRYRHEDNQPISLVVHPSSKLIFAAFGKQEGKRLNKEAFWRSHCPEVGRWANRNTLPNHFCVAFAHTDENGGANPVFFGPPFERLGNGIKTAKRSDA